MNRSLLYGFLLALVYEIVRSLRFLFTLYKFHRRDIVWDTVTGIPVLVAFGLFSGSVLQWLESTTTNHAGNVLVAVLCCFVAKIGEQILDTNGFLLAVPWESRHERRHTVTSAAIYFVSLLVAAAPLSFFPDGPSVILLSGNLYASAAIDAVAAVCLLTLLYYVFRYLHRIEKDYTIDNLRAILTSICNRGIISVDASFSQMVLADPETLESSLRITDLHMGSAMQFRVIQDGVAVPGLKESRLCKAHIRELAEAVQSEELQKLHLRKAMLQVLIGSEERFAEATTILRNAAIPPADIERLVARRKQLQ